MLKRSRVVGVGLFWAATVLGPPLTSSQVTQALETDYQSLVRRGHEFPQTAITQSILSQDPQSTDPEVLDAVVTWFARLYPDFSDRQIEALEDGIVDPIGAAARLRIMRWLSKSEMPADQFKDLAKKVMSRDSNELVREAMVEAIERRHEIHNVAEELFEISESKESDVVDQERFLSVRSLMRLAATLPPSQYAQVRVRVLALTQEDRPVAEEAMKAVATSIDDRNDRIEFLMNAIESSYHGTLAKLAALSQLKEEAGEYGLSAPIVGRLLRQLARANDSLNPEIKALTEDPGPFRMIDCGDGLAELGRRRPSKN